MMRALALVAVVAVSGCGAAVPKRCVDGRWPATADDYDRTTEAWTVRAELRDQYQEILEVAAVFKGPQWRAAYASRDAYFRKLNGPAREQRMAQAQADLAGPYEVELLVTTWDRRENDLDRGKKSVWRVVLVDEQDNEIEPIEIVKDKRPAFTVRADYAAFGDFATAYIARFPRTKLLLGDNVKQIRLRMSSGRGGVELKWTGEQCGAAVAGATTRSSQYVACLAK
jgi:hypothetical protein